MSNALDVIIVGGGPAGLSTALYLLQKMPAANILLIEAAQHPRPKLCGGGITFHGEEQLDKLDLHIDVPAFTIHQMRFRLGRKAFTIDYPDAMRIIQRDEFDGAIADAAHRRGLCVHANERLRDIRPDKDGVTVITDRGDYRARVVIGADGANSTVRRKLRLKSALGVARLLRTMTPIDAQTNPAWQNHTAVFDFSCVQNGIQGYYWDFPCYVDGQPFMNRGIFDSRIQPEPAIERANLKTTFFGELEARELDPQAEPLQGHPVRWFNPHAEFSRPRVLLAGDAAGVDPLFAEGISYALEYGEIVSGAVCDAFATNDFSFSDYRDRLLAHRLGHLLERRAVVASSLYQHRYPPLWSLLFQMADVSPAWAQRAVGSYLAVLP